MAIKDPFDTVRQHEYTGENRCTPCTIVNVAIAAAASAALSVASPILGVVSFAAFVGIIYLRGYLVPGTPTLTKKYLPEQVLAWFDKAPVNERTLGVDADSEADAEEALVGVGALKVCQDGTDLCLTDEFREAWRVHTDRLTEDEEAPQAALAELLEISSDRISVEERGSSFVAEIDGEQVGHWESHGAFVADMAAERALGERTNSWSELPVEQRGDLLASLRVFLERCPECGGRVALREETVGSCCRSWDVIAGACESCETRIFEIKSAKIKEETT